MPKLDNGATLTFSVNERVAIREGLVTNQAHTFSLNLEELNFTREHIQMALRDIKIVENAIRRFPDTAFQLLRAIQTGQLKAASMLLRSMGLTETAFSQGQGGLWGIVVLAVVFVFAMAKSEETPELPPPQYPSGREGTDVPPPTPNADDILRRRGVIRD